MSVERKPLDAQAYRSGNHIWTQGGKYSQVLEKLGLCALWEVIEIQKSFFSFPEEREGSSGRKLVSDSFSSWIHKVPASPGWWSLSKGAFLLTSFPSATRMAPRRAWWLEQAAKVGHSSAAYPVSSKWELYTSFTLDPAAAHPPRPWDLMGKSTSWCGPAASWCSWRELFLSD